MASGLALNLGANILADLLVGGGGTVFSNANARVGVGDDDTAVDAAQTDVVGTGTYKAMDATYPLVTAGVGVTVFQGTYAAAAIATTIKEISVDNGTTALLRIVLDATEQLAIPGAADIVRVTVTVTDA